MVEESIDNMQVEPVNIELGRGKSGLGFNIRGGIDIPHLPEDDGIFVSKIHSDGTAAKDGRLKEGDKILEVNGHNLNGVTHNEAVSFFRASDKVRLKVEPGAERRIMEQRARIIEETENPAPARSTSGGISVGLVLVGVAGAVAAVYIGYRFYKSKS